MFGVKFFLCSVLVISVINIQGKSDALECYVCRGEDCKEVNEEQLQTCPTSNKPTTTIPESSNDALIRINRFKRAAADDSNTLEDTSTTLEDTSTTIEDTTTTIEDTSTTIEDTTTTIEDTTTTVEDTTTTVADTTGTVADTTGTVEDTTTTIEDTTTTVEEPTTTIEDITTTADPSTTPESSTDGHITSCFVTFFEVNGESDVIRGCILRPEDQDLEDQDTSDSICMSAIGKPNATIETCRICEDDGCNSSGRSAIAFILMMFSLLIHYL